jgi:hypothetical protein
MEYFPYVYAIDAGGHLSTKRPNNFQYEEVRLSSRKGIVLSTPRLRAMEIDERRKPILSASVRPGLVTGSLVAAMLTAPLIAVFYLAWKVAGLPFVPFDVFDWMTRILPGQVLAAGIGTMVTVIRALNLGPTAAAAKAAEQAMAIASMFFAGLIAGTILFSIIRALRGRYARTLGLALGIA